VTLFQRLRRLPDFIEILYKNVYKLSSGSFQFHENLIGGSHTSLNGTNEFMGVISISIYRFDHRLLSLRKPYFTELS
jgi:hypothetical protein